MSTTVWTYHIPIGAGTGAMTTTVRMPTGARVVHVAIGPTTQDGLVTFWALLDVKAKGTEDRVFAVVATGEPIQRHWRYVGTATDPAAPLVWHLLEVETLAAI